MDEKKFETLSEQQQKKFLFKENIRLNELSQSLEEDRQLIDIQKGMLRSQQRKNQLMQKMSRYSLKVLMILTLLRNVTKIC